ncbi:MAG: hypothetical protein HY550_05575, partial [Elusimicrobia bacterium]|nr:hypothetical protein [Elusimicrobiota bacterium]
MPFKLEAAKIISTVERLRDRIGERFPEAGLFRVAGDFLRLSKEAAERAGNIGRPLVPLRAGIALLLLAFFAVLARIAAGFHVAGSFGTLTDLIQAVEASFNLIILLCGGIFFLVTLEARIKRKQALEMIHELRALAHIVDVHQLTKDPEQLLGSGRGTPSSPARTMEHFDLLRYLDYCVEILSLTGKIAALYAQHFNDEVVLEAVDGIEDLCNAFSQKIW